MIDNDTKRLSRLTAILIQLQSGRLLTARTLANRFQVSIRTIYRDIKSLESAGVPVLTEEGKGYTIMEGYKIPPVMFTETEANALITAECIINACKDQSLINEFALAIQKIKAVLPNRLKKQVSELQDKVAVTKLYVDNGAKSKWLLDIQRALIERVVVTINYTNASGISSTRDIEPFSIFANMNDEWVVVGFCRSRNEFRSFSLIRILQLTLKEEKFPHHRITLDEYVKKFSISDNP